MTRVLAHPLTADDRLDMLRRALSVAPGDALEYTPLARTWLCRQGVPAYEIDAGLVARAIINERQRRANIAAMEAAQ